MEPHSESGDDPLAGLQPAEKRTRAHELAMRETWRRFSSRHRKTDLEPFTAEWFQFIDQKRYLRHASWIPRLFEFAKHPGERVLVYGAGLGTDAIQYAAQGAKVTVCTANPDDLYWTRKNFEWRNLPASFHNCPSDSLPAISDTVDIVTVSCFDELPGSLPATLDEAWRVLRPGGKIIAALPAKREIGLDRSNLLRNFGRFEIRRMGKRHLRRSDLPSFVRWAYFPVLEHVLGRVFVVKAIKPIRAAVPLPQKQAA